MITPTDFEQLIDAIEKIGAQSPNGQSIFIKRADYYKIAHELFKAPTLPPNDHLSLEEVCLLTGIGKSRIYDLLNKKEFPRRTKYGWEPGTIREWKKSFREEETREPKNKNNRKSSAKKKASPKEDNRDIQSLVDESIEDFILNESA